MAFLVSKFFCQRTTIEAEMEAPVRQISFIDTRADVPLGFSLPQLQTFQPEG
ncbi:MAG TPA: hypothetical protein VGH39_14800 [Xanthobacteraceae bacterium]|jgi:hypothetical protein